MNSAIPVGPSLWLVYTAAIGVAYMTFMNGGDIMWSAVRGISALIVLSTLLWLAASIWRLPEKPVEEAGAPNEDEENALGGEDVDGRDQDLQSNEFRSTND